MSDAKGQDRNARIGLSRPAGSRIELKNKVETSTVRQSFSHGRSKAVAVEVKRAPRVGAKPQGRAAETPEAPQAAPPATTGRAAPAVRGESAQQRAQNQRRPVMLKPLTEDEKQSRLKALSVARKSEEEARKRAEENARLAREEAERRRAEEAAAAAKLAAEEAKKRAEEAKAAPVPDSEAATAAAGDGTTETDKAREAVAKASPAAPAPTDEAGAGRTARARTDRADETAAPAAAAPAAEVVPPPETGEPGKRSDGPKRAARTQREIDDEEDQRRRGPGRGKPEKRAAGPKLGRSDDRRGRSFVTGEDEDERARGRSLAAIRRRQERERRQQQQAASEAIVREVVLPEAITVQELANRMAVRGAEVIKSLMKSGIMATINHVLDADTAELVVEEFGHKAKRVSEADVEEGIEGVVDDDAVLEPRPPVVTVMGHVDHGKTSLLDALRNADVVAGEAGGITQHIGAYQVSTGDGLPVTFIDTPGHAAFTAMRARGAEVTDVVILVVAADDGVMPQTIEAIRHAKAAQVPIVVAINKIDKPDANPERVKTELLSHEVVVEEFGGDVLAIEVSATQKIGLDKLVEAIQLQAELLDLKANPHREAQGTVIEAKLDRGRGVVATVLVEKGTLKVGDIAIAGSQWGRMRALVSDRGTPLQEAGPATPVEVLGLDGVPEPGDKLQVVETEKRARDIADYRQRKRAEQRQVGGTGVKATSLEEMFNQMKVGALKELPLVIKADVHGSLEALTAGLEKLNTEEVAVRVMHGGVGAITESDVTLAMASGGVIMGFNVRANVQARDLAKREGIEIRYYSIIYELLDEVKNILSGMLAPVSKEVVLGHAEIREVFSISRVGKIAGCMVKDGLMKRGAKARLLRDDVVIFEGALGSLKRFKDDVREVREGFECGTSIEGFNDIKQGDVIEAFELQEEARSL